MPDFSQITKELHLSVAAPPGAELDVLADVRDGDYGPAAEQVPLRRSPVEGPAAVVDQLASEVPTLGNESVIRIPNLHLITGCL